MRSIKLSDNKARGIALMLLTVACFALLDALTKYLAQYYPVRDLVWMRYTVHVLLMTALLGPRMQFELLRTTRPSLQILRALLLLGTSLFMMTGLAYLPLAEASAINFTAPLMVTALSAPLLGEKTDRRDWVAVLFGFAGVLIIARPGGDLLRPEALLPLGAAVCYSLYQIMTRRFSGRENPLTTHFITGLVGALIMSVVLFPDFRLPTTLAHLGWILVLGGGAVAGHYLLIKALAQTGPAVVAPFTYTQLVWATLLGYFVFGEFPNVGSLLGILIIAGSGLYVAYHHNRRQRRRRAQTV